ncbi:FKBP-type peptidylprolyl isomerase [Flavobacteriaceae bacterium CRH]|nr:FKBP-type peptidylprolyl isomerase [Flavobacteriaceae bacterium CRH]
MNKFKYYFILLLAGIATVSCNKSDDNNETVPLRDYQEQYNTDNANIEEYLNTNYITVTENAGKTDDQDVVIDSITDPVTQPSIMSYLNSPTFPKLLSKNVDLDGITYKLYYLVLREGTKIAPVSTDGVVAAYSGEYMTRVEKTSTQPTYLKMTAFEKVIYPQTPIDLYSAIVGWGETFPEFKTGTSAVQSDGTIEYRDFGAGVLFIPSGLAYYAGSGTIPGYSPLVFSFKLYNVIRLDHDFDGVYDYQEDINNDRYLRDFRNTTLYPNAPVNPDDTDLDGIPDFLDFDDDGDGFSTFYEISKPTAEIGIVTDPITGNITNYGVSKYYPWDPTEDNPATPNTDETELRGIPRRPTGGLTKTDDPKDPVESATNPKKYVEEDYTASPRLRIHLDNTYPIKKK